MNACMTPTPHAYFMQSMIIDNTKLYGVCKSGSQARALSKRMCCVGDNIQGEDDPVPRRLQ